MWPSGPARLARLAATAFLLAAAGCASSRPAPPATPATPPAIAGLPSATTAGQAAGAAAAWEVPASAYGQQTLYRVMVTGAEGQGSLKLTLRLAAPHRYQAQAADPLGRALWSLDVDDASGLWLDHRARVYCHLAGVLDLKFLPLRPLSLDALPPLLLGRLPVAPADPATVKMRPLSGAGTGGADSEIAYDDTAGRAWTALLRDGQPLSWGLHDSAPGPVLSWLASGGWSVLMDRRKGVEVRWRQALREHLAPLAPLVPPADYRAGSCTPPPS